MIARAEIGQQGDDRTGHARFSSTSGLDIVLAAYGTRAAPAGCPERRSARRPPSPTSISRCRPAHSYGVIGPNSAGKTTTRPSAIMSILFPDAGEVSVLGHRSALEAKDRIGYLPEERGVYKRMKVAAFLTFMGQLKGVEAGVLPARVTRGLERVGSAAPRRSAARSCRRACSRGAVPRRDHPSARPVDSRRTVQRARSGQRAAAPRAGARGARTRRDDLLSTHAMTQAEECEHVVMIHRGRKVLDDSVAGAIRRRLDPRTIHFEPLQPGRRSGAAARAEPRSSVLSRRGRGGFSTSTC